MKILGIDPGLTAGGYAFIGADSPSPQLVSMGLFHNETTEGFVDDFYELIYDDPFIKFIAVESYHFFGRAKGKGSITTPHVIGVIMGVGRALGHPVKLIRPIDWRLALTGTRSPSDEQIRKCVEQNLEYKFPPQKKYQHAIEAAAVAIVAEGRFK